MCHVLVPTFTMIIRRTVDFFTFRRSWWILFTLFLFVETIKEKYYHSWSFLRTPAWRQVEPSCWQLFETEIADQMRIAAARPVCVQIVAHFRIGRIVEGSWITWSGVYRIRFRTALANPACFPRRRRRWWLRCLPFLGYFRNCFRSICFPLTYTLSTKIPIITLKSGYI